MNGRDAGMVTAELAAGLPVLVLVVAVAVGAVTVAGAKVRAQDAAREAARSAARFDARAADASAHHAAPGARIEVLRTGDIIAARASITVHPLAGWLPAVTVSERAVALVEPT